MIATLNQQNSSEDLILFSFANLSATLESSESDINIPTISKQPSNTNVVLSNKAYTHDPKAGINPLVDSAAYLFSIIGKLKLIKPPAQFSKLQADLIQEMDAYLELIKVHGYNAEYVIVCRFILCATFDDLISHTRWGEHGNWDPYSLLAAYKQDMHHQDKFFAIMERIIKSPDLYIEMMELMYLCLSLGYKGHYRTTEHSIYQLDQMTNNLFKHIQAYRGGVNKTLSPIPLLPPKTTSLEAMQKNSSLVLIFINTACVIMTIFISLGYLMDVISNEAYKNITQIQSPFTHQPAEQ